MAEKVLMGKEIIARNEAMFSFDDRSMYFGDGIYEVVRIYGGHPYQMEMHMQRLQRSAEEMDIPFSTEDKQTLSASLNELKNENHLQEGILYVQVSRGAAERNHLYERHEEPVVFAFTKEMPRPLDQLQSGIAVYLTEDERWLRCDIKSVNLLGNVLAKRKAADHDCQEAVLHRGNEVTEGSSSNLFIVKDNELQTHPATNLILNGITRQVVLEYAEQLGKSVRYDPIDIEDLAGADEAFITSTTNEVTPITEFRGTKHVQLKVGEITKQLQERFEDDVKKTESGT
ncbi:D-amino-acid transaminase [Geomicrobium sp. JSM 1781026]|uniref:D-amino-acid transaminase n=1 Tax=Geomicrobium sp. JSM 1781026 TaxID=3344580 RepID=UPI0035C1407C